MKKYKWLFLDADDTLLDFKRAEHDALTETLMETGILVDDETVDRYSRINDALWKALERGEVTKERLRTLRFERFLADVGSDADPEDIARRYEAHLSEKSYLIPGAEETCRKLAKGYGLYVITNGIAFIQHSRIGNSGLRPYLNGLFISEEVGAEKPKKDFFDHVSARIDGFDPRFALVIGDSLTSDISGGAAYGMDTCWVNATCKPIPKGSGVTYVIRSIRELPGLLDLRSDTENIFMNIYDKTDKNDKLKNELSAAGIKCETLVPLAAHTSFRIGGNADIGVFPDNKEEFAAAVRIIRSAKIPYFVLGNGSNTVFADEGFRGAVIFTRNMKNVTVDREKRLVCAECGASLTLTAAEAKDAGLAGLEFSYGIPGSCGGAVTMNAGAYGGQIADAAQNVELYDTSSDRFFTLSRDEMDFSYRHSIVKDHPEYAVISVTFRLSDGDKEAIAGKMRELMERRRDKQPLELPSAGSVFKRPAPDLFVGKMVEESGLKGTSVGGAQVSPKHAGFIVNNGGAAARDVRDLVELVKSKIRENYGVELECEILFVPETL